MLKKKGMLTVVFCIGEKKWSGGSFQAQRKQIRGLKASIISLFWTLPSKEETVTIHPSNAQWPDTQFGVKPEPFIRRNMVPLCWILLNSSTSWLLPLSFSLSLMHVTNLLSTETAAIWVPRRAQTMKHRSYKHDEQATNVCHLVSYRECLDEPKRAVLCWFMNRFCLCYQEATTEQLTEKGQDFASLWRVWRAGKCSSPQLQQDKVLPITNEAAAVPRQSLQTGLEGSFASGVPIS